MCEIRLNHGDHVDTLHARQGILIVTTRGWPPTNRRQRIMRRLFARFM